VWIPSPFWKVRVPLVLVKVPPDSVKSEFEIVIALSPPLNVPSACEYPSLPTVTVFPLLCVIVPVYPELILIPCTLTLVLIVQLSVL
jgi:hypothetical protein